MILRNNRKIAIIIPTYQAQHWLERCLTEVRQLILPIQYQLVTVVVDNASTDGTVEYLEKCSDIKFLPQTKNKGFAGANNIGLAWADHWGADYVFLLNQDVYCAPEVLTQLVDFLEIRPAAVAVQPQILGYPETYSGRLSSLPWTWL
ncbi:MAG: glycosyltransferase [Candidatus Komeilibacteria bacterium]|nr:glycosyltransferase [Candidatus Komeilibacteria bacterium]